MATATLLTDFGTADYYVAALKGTLLRLAPGAVVLVDVTHEVAPGDVEDAAFLLAAAARWFPPGTVHLAVVDPGVGGGRRILAAEGAGGGYLVAPDNGLLTPFLDGAPAAWGVPADGPPPEVRAVERSEIFLPGPGATFHGRDRLAPAAAWLLRGEPLAALGPVVDDPVRLPWTAPRAEGEPPRLGAAGAVLRGRVARVDRFGNLVTDLPADWAGDGPLVAEVAGSSTAHRATHYRDIPPGEAAVLAGSLGTLELSLDGASLAERWGVERGAPVTVRLLAG